MTTWNPPVLTNAYPLNEAAKMLRIRHSTLEKRIEDGTYEVVSAWGANEHGNFYGKVVLVPKSADAQQASIDLAEEALRLCLKNFDRYVEFLALRMMLKTGSNTWITYTRLSTTIKEPLEFQFLRGSQTILIDVRRQFFCQSYREQRWDVVNALLQCYFEAGMSWLDASLATSAYSAVEREIQNSRYSIATAFAELLPLPSEMPLAEHEDQHPFQ